MCVCGIKKSIRNPPWKIRNVASAYNNTSKHSSLFQEEKIFIITFPDENKLLHKQSEIISKCRHKRYLLSYLDDYKN